MSRMPCSIFCGAGFFAGGGKDFTKIKYGPFSDFAWWYFWT